MHRTPPSQSCMLTVDGTLKAGIDTLPSGCIQVGIDDEQIDALIKSIIAMCGWCRSSQIDGANGQTLLLELMAVAWM